LPAFIASLVLRDPMLVRDGCIAGAALALAGTLAWLLGSRLPRFSERRLLAIAILLAGLPTVLAAFALDTALTNDERAYLYQAEMFSQGKLVEPLPAAPELFHQRQVFNDEERGIRYSKYPPGTALGLTPGVLAERPLLSTLLAGILDVVLVAAIARRIGLRSPSLAALLLAVSPFFLLVQTSVQSEVFAFPALLAGYWALLRARANASSSIIATFGALVGAFTGFVFLCRPLTGVLMAIALGVGLFSSVRRAPAAIGAVIGGSPFAVAFLLYNRALTGDAFGIPYHRYALKYGPFDATGHPLDIFGHGDFVNGLLAQASRWSVGFAGILGVAALGFWGLWRLRARDGGTALVFAPLGLLAYSLHWYAGHKFYLGPLHCYESLGFLLCGALVILEAAPERWRRGIVLAAACAGPIAFAIRFDSMLELSALRSTPQRAARATPPGSVIVFGAIERSVDDDPCDKYYTPSKPPRRADESVLVREPVRQPLHDALIRAGLDGRPVFRFVADPGLRSGRLERVHQP
jgi:hypothetical protein